MTLRVIGAGLSRTGTYSLKLALTYLGFGPCYHMSELVGIPDAVQDWTDAANGKPDWPKIFDGFESATDFPTCFFYRELAEFYPDSKFILTWPTAARWYESMKATVFSPENIALFKAQPPLWDLICRVLPFGFMNNNPHSAMPVRAYCKHCLDVIEYFPRDRFLVYHVEQGWEPLCQLLNVPVPDIPFPHANKRTEFGHLAFKG